MKALSHILLFVLLLLGSCTPSLYTGPEYDDLYYSASDKPVVKEKYAANEQLADKNLKADSYYDNVYASDTLVSGQYSVPSDYDDQIIVNNNNMGSGGYDYYDDSYANRINMFYGNSLYPYWRDPYYYGYGYPSFGLSFGFGYPSFGFGFGYGYGFGGYPYYAYPYYGYGGYYGCCYPYYEGYHPYYGDDHYTAYGRRERPTSLSSSSNQNVTTSGSSRRNSNLSSAGNSATGGRTYSGTQSISTDSRRSVSNSSNFNQAARTTESKVSQDPVKSDNTRSAASVQRTPANAKPEYKSVNRSYTPSYSNPRMSTRPSYNNSRVHDGANSGTFRNNGTVNNSRSSQSSGSVRIPSNQNFNQNSGNTVRSNSSPNTMQKRYGSPSNSNFSRQYSVPTRRSAESVRSYSSGSYNSSSSGSSSSGSRSSYSSGSSSGSSSSRSSSSSHSSSGRR
jgi:hypothetical protein